MGKTQGRLWAVVMWARQERGQEGARLRRGCVPRRREQRYSVMARRGGHHGATSGAVTGWKLQQGVG